MILVSEKTDIFPKLASAVAIQVSHCLLGFFSVLSTLPDGDTKVLLHSTSFWSGNSDRDGEGWTHRP